MKRLLIAVLVGVISISAALAQLTATGAGGAFGGAASYVGAGDVVSSAAHWYGLRCYNAAYSGNVADVYAPADASHTLITCSVGGILNQTLQSLATTCATSCTVKTLTDQAGGGADISQATIANRPAFSTSCAGLSGTVKWCMIFTATSSQTMATASAITTIAQPFSASAVSKNNLSSSWGNIFNFNASTTWEFDYLCCGGNIVRVGSAGGTFDAAATDGIWYAFQTLDSGNPNVSTTVNGTTTTGSIADGNGLAGVLSVGGGGSSPGFMTGTLTEVGFWPVAFTAPQLASMTTNQRTYYGF